MKIRMKLLGTGGSFGTPTIGCDCLVCRSTDPKNKRLRTSCLVEVGSKRFLVDVSPDIRYACLKYEIDHLDGVLITHFHEDHVGGLNDLRPLYIKGGNKRMPLFLAAQTLDVVEKRFDYLMDRFDVILLKGERGKMADFTYFSFLQIDTFVNGFRFGQIAYLTDIKEYKAEIFQDLKGVQVVVLGAIHEQGTPMHFSFHEAIDFGKMTGAKRIILTHLAHDTDHEEGNQKMPQGVEIGYDGMVIDV